MYSISFSSQIYCGDLRKADLASFITCDILIRGSYDEPAALSQ